MQNHSARFLANDYTDVIIFYSLLHTQSWNMLEYYCSPEWKPLHGGTSLFEKQAVESGLLFFHHLFAMNNNYETCPWDNGNLGKSTKENYESRGEALNAAKFLAPIQLTLSRYLCGDYFLC